VCGIIIELRIAGQALRDFALDGIKGADELAVALHVAPSTVPSGALNAAKMGRAVAHLSCVMVWRPWFDRRAWRQRRDRASV
jgi:hypothetical protein